MKILIVYGTHFGQTAKIGERIADRLRDCGHEATLENVRAKLSPDAIAEADAVIIGASVEGGKHRREIVAFVRDHRELLDAKTSAFFSVNMSRAKDTEDAKKPVTSYLEMFSAESGWKPEQREAFAGALMYRRYNFFLRFVMRLIAGRGGLSTDTSKNHEYTDWQAVDAFADAFDRGLRSIRAAPALAVSQSRTHEAAAHA
jgi:menaquinone-dependent protoporphyrinogen oxidase